MNARRIIRKPGVALLVVLVTCVVCGAVGMLYQSAYNRALAQYEDLISNHRIDSLEALIAELAHMQFGGLPPLPGTEPWEQSAGPYPVDWEDFPKELQNGLIGYWEGSVPVYDIHIYQDQQTREIVILNSDLVEIFALPCPYESYCKPETYALYLRSDLYSGKYTSEQIAQFNAERDPARVGLRVTLVPTDHLFDYLYARETQQEYERQLIESEGGGEQMMMSMGGGGTLDDLDGDGVSNRDEILAGTDPLDPDDFLRITEFELDPDNHGIVFITWPSVTNREYSIYSAEGDDALLASQSWFAVTQWLAGADADLVSTQDLTSAVITTAFFRVQVRETDANANGLPDWWEIEQFGGLTNILASGDEDGDGLDNLEELYYGRDPNEDDRTVIYSAFHTVEVNSNDPAGADDGTERFDCHGGSRPLPLASNAVDESYVQFHDVESDRASSGGIFFNNDMDNLYIGIRGSRIENNAIALFIDTGSGGVTNLRHLNSASQPYGFSRATNINFHATEFKPSVGLLLGSMYGDGRNYPDFNIGGVNYGQGVYDLSDNSHFGSFTTSEGHPISQWGGDDADNAHKGIEVALNLDELGVGPGDPIKVALIVIGGNDGASYTRWVAGEAYGKSISGSGFNQVTVIGHNVRLSGVRQTLPPNTYPCFTDDDVMLQAFYWDVEPRFTWWTNLTGRVPDIADAGFTMVWLPPPYKGASGGFSVGYDPFDHYDLGEYNQRGTTPTRYGTKAELTNLITSLHAANIQPLCDIVLNHMAGGSGTGNKTYTYTHGTFQKTATDFHPSAEGHNHELFPYQNNWGFGDPLNNPVDVAFMSPNMRLGLKQWGGWLVTNINFSGFRFDFTQGVEPWYIWEWLNYPAQRGTFAFMEYWENANAADMQEWLDLTGRRAAIYDWNLRDEYLKPMCEGNGSFDMTKLEAPSLLGIEPAHTVVYIDTHDTFRFNDPGKTGIAQDKPMAYAYAFHSQGLPMVFYHDYYLAPYLDASATNNFGTPLTNDINRLIRIRKAAVAGEVEVLHADTDLYIQLRTGSESKSASIMALNDHTSNTLSESVQTPWLDTALIDLVTGNTNTLVTTDGDGYATLGAPPRSYRIYAPTNILTQVEQ
jgi:alpha-amylase